MRWSPRNAVSEPSVYRVAGALSPLSPVRGGEGLGVRGLRFPKTPPPHPRPLSPEYRGEGSNSPQWAVLASEYTVRKRESYNLFRGKARCGDVLRKDVGAGVCGRGRGRLRE